MTELLCLQNAAGWTEVGLLSLAELHSKLLDHSSSKEGEEQTAELQRMRRVGNRAEPELELASLIELRLRLDR